MANHHFQWVNLFGPLEMDDPFFSRCRVPTFFQEWDLALDLQLQQFAQRFLVDGPIFCARVLGQSLRNSG
jgi:hypothetical protein